MKPTVLFVTEIRPYPLHGGMHIHIYNVLESLCRHFQVIVLAPPVAAECPLLNWVVKWRPLPEYEISLSAKATNGRHLLQPRPAWQACLQALLQEYQPHVVWFNYGHWGQYAPLVHRYGAIAVMRSHNVQSEITRQRAATLSGQPVWIPTRLRAWLEAYHERHLFRHFDRVVSVTEIDRRYHAQFVGDRRSRLIPNYINERRYEGQAALQRAEQLLILTGSFDSFQNVQGVVWFNREIWPQLKAAWPTVRLQLVGTGAQNLPDAILQDQQIEAIDSVPDMVPYLRNATIAVVPLRHGSGMRFKILEALACELPVVSTTLGARGIVATNGESMLLADSAADFTQAILMLLHDRAKRTQLAEQGLAILRQHYTAAVNTTLIRQLVEEVTCQTLKPLKRIPRS